VGAGCTLDLTKWTDTTKLVEGGPLAKKVEFANGATLKLPAGTNAQAVFAALAAPASVNENPTVYVEVGGEKVTIKLAYTLTLNPNPLNLTAGEYVLNKPVVVSYDLGGANVTLKSLNLTYESSSDVSSLTAKGLTYQTNSADVTAPTVTVSGTPNSNIEGLLSTVTVKGTFSDGKVASADLRVNVVEATEPIDNTGILQLTPPTLTMVLNQYDSKTVSAGLTVSSSEKLYSILQVTPQSQGGVNANHDGSIITIWGTPTSSGLKPFVVTGTTTTGRTVTATLQVTVLASAGTDIVISDPADAVVYTDITGVEARYFYNAITGESNFNVGRKYTMTIPCSASIELPSEGAVQYSSPTSSTLQSLPVSSYRLVTLPDGACNVVFDFTPTSTGTYKFYINYLYGGTQYTAPLTFVATRATSGGSGLDNGGGGGCSSLGLSFAALALAGLALLRRRG
jgi:hypothetical protein